MSVEDFDQIKPMKAQAWCDLLGLDFLKDRQGLSSNNKPNLPSNNKHGQSSTNTPSLSFSKGPTASQWLKDAMIKFLEGCLDIADASVWDEVEADSVSWNGVDFDAMQDCHFEEVLWEFAELNFWFELAALDAHMSGLTVYEWEHLVAECFPELSPLIVKLECADQGLESLHWKQRARYLHALRQLMKTWTVCNKPEIIEKKMITWHATEIDTLEEAMTKLYCQEFYDHFCCAPIVLHCLSHAAPSEKW